MKQRCETCPSILDCKTAFGKYWGEKSSGGVGCDYPFSYEDNKHTTTRGIGTDRAETTTRIMKQEKLI